MSAASEQYDSGYYKGHGFPAKAQVELATAAAGGTQLPQAYQAGLQDGLAGQPYGANFREDPVAQTPGQTGAFYEVLATNVLTGRMPYDLAVSVERKPNQGLILNLLQAAIGFQVLGADPTDWTQGYRLSGPKGPIAQRVGSLVRQGVLRQSDPAFFGLDAWYGAKTQEGFRLLGRAELQALGLV